MYDIGAFRRTRQLSEPQPAIVSTLTRETHVGDARASGVESRVQLAFSYLDGLGRRFQTKLRADPGPLVPDGPTVTPRFLRSGWARQNNKGNPYRRSSRTSRRRIGSSTPRKAA